MIKRASHELSIIATVLNLWFIVDISNNPNISSGEYIFITIVYVIMMLRIKTLPMTAEIDVIHKNKTL